MKRIFAIFFTLLTLGASSSVAQNADRLFAYPEPPRGMENLYERCNYMVYKFWDQCNMKAAMSAKSKLNDAFGFWLAFTPYASADTVYMAVDKLNALAKKNGQQSLEIMRLAENWLYSDTATFRSEDLYSRFVDAAVANKKIPAVDRQRYEQQKRILDSSSVGRKIPDLPVTLADGTKSTLCADSAEFYLLFIHQPDNFDCKLGKTRLAADMILNQLNAGGVVRVITLYDGEPDASFYEAVALYPKEWINAASPEVSKYFDLRTIPAIYYLDKNYVIQGKDLKIDNILAAFRQLMR